MKTPLNHLTKTFTVNWTTIDKNILEKAEAFFFFKTFAAVSFSCLKVTGQNILRGFLRNSNRIFLLHSAERYEKLQSYLNPVWDERRKCDSNLPRTFVAKNIISHSCFIIKVDNTVQVIHALKIILKTDIFVLKL